MALGIVKYAYDRSYQQIGVIWFAVSLPRLVVVDSVVKVKALFHMLTFNWDFARARSSYVFTRPF